MYDLWRNSCRVNKWLVSLSTRCQTHLFWNKVLWGSTDGAGLKSTGRSWLYPGQLLTLLTNMAARVILKTSAVRRTLLALSLPSRTPGPPAAAVGLRCLHHAAPGEKKTVVLESAEEYKFVERLIPPTRVPSPPKHAGPTPSGWTPPSDSPPTLSYMIRRSRMHNIPVYTEMTNGNRRTTLVRKVEGDIWALEKDVKQYLMEVTGKELPTRVNEVTMTLRVKGHFEDELKEWLVRKGFWLKWWGETELPGLSQHLAQRTDGQGEDYISALTWTCWHVQTLKDCSVRLLQNLVSPYRGADYDVVFIPENSWSIGIIGCQTMYITVFWMQH